MTKTIKECDLFHNPPSDPNDKKWDEIIKKTLQYSPPIEEDGLEHLERVVLPVSHPNRKSGDDNSSLNASRTTKPKRDNLITIHTRGINVTCKPLKTVITNPDKPREEWKDDLTGGYGRSAYFDELGIPCWVYDRYRISDAKGEFQEDDGDVVDDTKLTDNAKSGGSQNTKDDYVAAAVGKIDKYGVKKWDKNKLKNWLTHVSKGELSDKQVSSYADDAHRKVKARGRIDHDCSVENHVKKQAKEQKLGKIIPLNTDGADKQGNRQRIQRKIFAMMRDYIDSGGQTQNFAVFNSIATTHEEFDNDNSAMVNILDEELALIQEFASKRLEFGTKPGQITHVLGQRIKTDNPVNSLFPYTS
tara:strand:- start:167 stop:1243 length:1077 start_codon:yes stop_codon:yes gene_type:complete